MGRIAVRDQRALLAPLIDDEADWLARLLRRDPKRPLHVAPDRIRVDPENDLGIFGFFQDRGEFVEGDVLARVADAPVARYGNNKPALVIARVREPGRIRERQIQASAGGEKNKQDSATHAPAYPAWRSGIRLLARNRPVASPSGTVGLSGCLSTSAVRRRPTAVTARPDDR